MNQLQFYKSSTIALLVLNMAMIGFFFLTKPPHPPGRGGQIKAIDLLKLDQQQHREFLQLVKKHQQQMETINAQQGELLKPYFYRLVDSSRHIDPLALQQMKDLEQRKISSTFQHLQDVKALLRPEQEANFEAFMNHALERILIKKKKPPHPPKDF